MPRSRASIPFATRSAPGSSFSCSLTLRGYGARERSRPAREAPLRGQRPVALPPDVRLDPDLPLAHLVDVEAASLPAPARPRLPEAGRDGDGDAALAARRD